MSFFQTQITRTKPAWNFFKYLSRPQRKKQAHRKSALNTRFQWCHLRTFLTSKILDFATNWSKQETDCCKLTKNKTPLSSWTKFSLNIWYIRNRRMRKTNLQLLLVKRTTHFGHFINLSPPLIAKPRVFAIQMLHDAPTILSFLIASFPTSVWWSQHFSGYFS